MSRLPKKPLPFTFGEIVTAIADGKGAELAGQPRLHRFTKEQILKRVKNFKSGTPHPIKARFYPKEQILAHLSKFSGGSGDSGNASNANNPNSKSV
jgi:hypothetical protein